MSARGLDARPPPALARWAALLLALDAAAIGGVRLRGGAGPRRDAWLASLRATCPPSRPWQRLPLSIGDDRLLGGLDLVATLAQGRSVAQRGLLAECDGGLVVVPMAERLPRRVAASIASVLDRGEVLLERDGFAERHPARLAVVALDEGLPDDPPLAAALAERLALDVRVDEPPSVAAGTASSKSADARGPDNDDADEDPWPEPPDESALTDARRRWRDVAIGDAAVQALCGAAAALGVDSMRRAHHALQAARMVAALGGRSEVVDEDVRLALGLVVLPHATRVPAAAAAREEADDPTADDPAEPAPPSAEESTDQHAAGEPPPPSQALDENTETLVAATLANLPAAVLAQLAGSVAAARARQTSTSEGRSGALAASRLRGRPLGTRPGDPRRGDRLSIVDTLRAAAPWQRVRRAQATPELEGNAGAPRATAAASAPSARLHLRRDDLRVVRRAQRRGSTTIFVIDASGSSALHRLAEAKGAVELLLAESYVRRDEVAVIAFRGASAELLLPPTRSLVRAKRALAGLPGGGGTPLATALDTAGALAEQVARRGATPAIVLLSDGRANVPRQPGPATPAAAAGAGSAHAPARPADSAVSPATALGGRARAEADALASARLLASGPARALFIDTSPQPSPGARRLAAQMGATYLPLPHARADAVSAAARALRSEPAVRAVAR